MDLWRVTDLKSFLSGSWQISRYMLDRRNVIGGEFRGQAQFKACDGSLLYEERGTLNFGAHSGRAEQRYRYDFRCGDGRATICFRDGRAFHELDLSQGRALVGHICGPDRYEGCFTAVDWGQWQSSWTVAGPRKDQEITTLFNRLG